MQSAFGGAPFEQRLAVLEAAAADDVAGALVGVHDLVASGHDVRRVADDLLRTLRDAFLQANASGRVPYDGAPEECERLAALAKEMGNPAVVRAIEILGDAIVDIRGQAVADPRLVLEVAVVRIARREARTREETLLDRVERLEQRLGRRRADAMHRAGAPRPRRARAPAPVPGGPVLARRERAAKAGRVGASSGRAGPGRRQPAAPAERDDPSRPAPTRRRSRSTTSSRRGRRRSTCLKAPVRAGIQDAQPIALENGDHRLRGPEACATTRSTSGSARRPPRSRTRSRHGSAPRRGSCCAPHDFDTARRVPARRQRRTGRR